MPPSSRPDGGAARGDRAPDGERLRALLALAEGRGDDRQRGGGDQRAAEALEGPCADQHRVRGRQAVEQRCEREDRRSRHEQPPPADQVGHAPAQQQEAAEHQRVAVDDPLQRGVGEAEVGLDRRQRDVHDGGVEDDHELREADDDERQPGVHRGQVRVKAPFHVGQGIRTGVRTPLKRSKDFACVTRRTELGFAGHGEAAWAGAPGLAGGGRYRSAIRRWGRGKAEGGDHPQQGRDPDDPRRHLQGPRLRLRLRVRRGQHLHDGRVLRDVGRRALEVLRPRRAARAEGLLENLDSDLFYERIKDVGIIDKVRAEPPPVGPKKKVKQTVKGYVAGYNRYLRQDRRRQPLATRPAPARPGSATSPPPTSGAASTSSASSPRAGGRGRDRRRAAARRRLAGAGAAGSATPARSPRSARRSTPSARQRLERLGHRQRRDARTAAAWCSATRTSPGRGPSASTSPTSSSRARSTSPGASLFGVPVIASATPTTSRGAHTVSTAFRFVPIQLTLVPGDPTSYLVDGQPEADAAATSPSR